MSNESIETVALIGVGRMGRGIGRNLLRHGFRLSVFDVDIASTKVLTDLGARLGASIADAVGDASFVITCLPDASSVQQAYQASGGILENARVGSLLTEMGTISPEQAKALGVESSQRGLSFVDAPMLRGATQAWDGTIHILLGGDNAGKERASALLAHVAERVIDAGPLGNGQALKAINNAVTMANCAVLGEALYAARAAGFSAATFVDVLQSGLAGSRILDLYAPRFTSGEHPRTGLVRTAEKDLDLFLQTARSQALDIPVLQAVHAAYSRMCKDGEGEAPLSGLADLYFKRPD